MIFFRKIFFVLLLGLFSASSFAQQDPQFTQYMYNTMTVNPAYAGSQGHSVITLLGRTQWVGINGAPNTQTLSFDTPLNSRGLGLGVNVMNDEIGPAQEIYVDANFSYAIEATDVGRLAFGLKTGLRHLNVDVSKLNPEKQSDVNLVNVNKVFPTVGAGLYYYTNKYYLGIAVPNMIKSKHYKETIKGGDIASERFHFFAIAGYVFDLNDNLKFKPAALLKGVSGAPVSLDVSANFLYNERLYAGVAWRWDDSVSALLGYQVSDRFHIGFAYDLTTSEYRPYNNGTYEVLLRYEFRKPNVIISPRFF